MLRKAFGAFEGVNGYAGALHDAVMDQGVALDFRFVAAAVDDDAEAAGIEVASDDIAVAAVVAFATNNVHRPAAAETEENLRVAATGVFHEDDTRNPELFDGAAVELADLGAGEGLRHGGHGRSLLPIRLGLPRGRPCRFLLGRGLLLSDLGLLGGLHWLGLVVLTRRGDLAGQGAFGFGLGGLRLRHRGLLAGGL